MLLLMSSSDSSHCVALLDGDEDWEDLSGEVALEEAHGVAFRLAAGEGLLDVCAGFRMRFHPDENDPVERGVALPVPAPVEAVPVRFPGRCRDGGGACEVSQGGFAADPVDVFPRDGEQGRGNVG